jgi:DNA adenine methylase
MPTPHSPLRYPGGKQILAKVIAHLIHLNRAQGGVYAEPYAGGAGAALALLFGEHVDRILINDADPCIYAFWNAAVNQTERFVDLIHTTPLTVAEWRRQRHIYQHPRSHSAIKVGFATFYLNRCNRSGIIGNGGPIGGIGQKGKWKIDARFNRDELGNRLRKIALYKERISVFGLDAVDFLKAHVAPLTPGTRTFVYLDPPYFAKGQDLYLNHYKPDDHATLADYVKGEAKFTWVMSYDDVPEITGLYTGMRQVPFHLDYSARDRRTGGEVLISRQSVRFPERWEKRVPSRFITAADNVVIPASG